MPFKINPICQQLYIMHSITYQPILSLTWDFFKIETQGLLPQEGRRSWNKFEKKSLHLAALNDVEGSGVIFWPRFCILELCELLWFSFWLVKTWWTWKPWLPGGFSPLISPEKLSSPFSFSSNLIEPFKAPFNSHTASFSSLKEKRYSWYWEKNPSCHRWPSTGLPPPPPRSLPTSF